MNFAALLAVSCGCIAVCLAAPTIYDQRQDGHFNLAAKLENIMILVAIPSKVASSSSATSGDELDNYLALLNGRHRPTALQLGQAAVDEPSEDPKVPEEAKEPEVPAAASPKARHLRSRDEDEIWGRSSTKEFVHDEGANRSGERNEVGAHADHQLKLIGSGIEDCGPDRRRNSYGICQPFSE